MCLGLLSLRSNNVLVQLLYDCLGPAVIIVQIQTSVEIYGNILFVT